MSGSVSGSVFDSVAGRPVVGAQVQLVSTSLSSWERSVITDAKGRFHFDSVAVGSYLLGFYDAALDSLGLEAPLRKVDVRNANEVRVALAIPSPASIIRFNCKGEQDSTGLIVGVVRSARDGAPVSNARVRVRWSELFIGSNGVEQRSPFSDALSGTTGGFALCGIPAASSSTVEVRAWNGADSSGFVELDVPANGLLRRDMYIGTALRAPDELASARGSTRPDSISSDTSDILTPRLRGNGRLKGIVRTDKGKPLNGAHVTIVGSGADFISRDDGTFAMQSLPTGTYVLEARAIGFVGIRHVVDIVETDVATLDLMLPGRNRFLDTVRVLGQRTRNMGFDGFERRKEAGLGTFLDAEKIADMKPLYTSDLFRAMHGVQVSIPSGGTGSTFGYRVSMRSMSGATSRCTPTIYVDRLPLLDDLDRQIPARDIVAVEVYRDWGSVPAEFFTGNYCGAIVIWTKLSARR